MFPPPSALSVTSAVTSSPCSPRRRPGPPSTLWASVKVFGEDVPEEVRKEIIDGLRANFEGECSEVGMYLAMARVAHREGYPEIGMYWEKAGL